ncbi:MAG: adenylate kinase [Bacilli bacterium]|jgi:adenylate kinase|nr:adenylate kinase [Acholeplasmataceae bacterium]
MRLLIMGPPGAGKGSQAELIAKHYSIPHISTGDMFRKAISEKTPTGLLAKSYIDKGELVPDQVTTELVRGRLKEADARDGFLLDGFPRTIAQAGMLEEILQEEGIKIDLVINLVVEDDTLIRRISGRRICKTCGRTYHVDTKRPAKEGECDHCGGELFQRADDNEETVRNRLAVYYRETEPLLECYQAKGLLKNIDGEGSIEAIFEEVKAVLGGI